MAKRRTVVDDLRALNGGGLAALRVAEALLGNADEQIQIRVSAGRKRLYEAAAKHAGAKSVSAWIRSLADAALG